MSRQCRRVWKAGIGGWCGGWDIGGWVSGVEGLYR